MMFQLEEKKLKTESHVWGFLYFFGFHVIEMDIRSVIAWKIIMNATTDYHDKARFIFFNIQSVVRKVFKCLGSN